MTKQLEARPKVAIKDCVGKVIVCPDCGALAEVFQARGSGTKAANRIATSQFWVMMRCKGFCGSKLMRIATPVELAPQPVPRPELSELGKVLGRRVRCPIEGCGQASLASFDIDDSGQVIVCPVHQSEHYDSTTIVELV